MDGFFCLKKGSEKMNKINVLLLSANNYDFVDEQTKRQVKGTTLWVMPLESSDPYTNGNKPVKYSLNSDFEPLFNSIELPCYAEMTIEFNLSRNKISPTHFDNFAVFESGVDVG